MNTNRPPFNVATAHAVVRIAEVARTVDEILKKAAASIAHFFLGFPDMVQRYQLDPEHKTGCLLGYVLLDETCTPEEIAAARTELLAQFDRFVEASRPKYSRIQLPAGAQQKTSPGGILLN